MKEICKRPRIWSMVYSVILVIFTVYVLLDTFVIPKGTQSVERNDEWWTNNSTSDDGSGNNSIDNSSASNVWSDEVILTDDEYRDSNIAIKITTLSQYDTTMYIADVQIRSIQYLQTAFANGTYGRNIKATTSAQASQNNAILAINGDYYGFRDYGFVLRNGVLYRSSARDSSSDDALVINADGTFKTVDENTSSASELAENGALQILSFGPTLISNGELKVTENSEVNQSMTSNPRTAIGIVEPLHYIVLVSDGRTSASAGLSLFQLANTMYDLGCTTAYNLDGGGSSTMWFNGKVLNVLTNGSSDEERKVSDIVYIGY